MKKIFLVATYAIACSGLIACQSSDTKMTQSSFDKKGMRNIAQQESMNPTVEKIRNDQSLNGACLRLVSDVLLTGQAALNSSGSGTYAKISTELAFRSANNSILTYPLVETADADADADGSFVGGVIFLGTLGLATPFINNARGEDIKDHVKKMLAFDLSKIEEILMNRNISKCSDYRNHSDSVTSTFDTHAK